jgi:tRNA (pseudouridine54-N1)-methyltransferase
MRRFLLLAHRVPTGGQFTLNDLAGGGGRIDEVARSVSTGFLLSNDLRRDTEMTILFASDRPPGPRHLRLIGERLRHLNPDERSTAALLKNALVRGIPAEYDVESSPGILVGPSDPSREITEFVAQPGAIWLTEDGAPLEESADAAGDFAAVLCDPYGPAPEEEALLARLAVPRVSLGPRSMRASQCIDVLQNHYDRREALRARAPP